MYRPFVRISQRELKHFNVPVGIERTCYESRKENWNLSFLPPLAGSTGISQRELKHPHPEWRSVAPRVNLAKRIETEIVYKLLLLVQFESRKENWNKICCIVTFLNFSESRKENWNSNAEVTKQNENTRISQRELKLESSLSLYPIAS